MHAFCVWGVGGGARYVVLLGPSLRAHRHKRLAWLARVMHD